LLSQITKTLENAYKDHRPSSTRDLLKGGLASVLVLGGLAQFAAKMPPDTPNLASLIPPSFSIPIVIIVALFGVVHLFTRREPGERLTRPIKIYLTLDMLTSGAQYLEMVVLPLYIAHVTGNAWHLGISMFAYLLLYSLAPMMGSITDMNQKNIGKMFRSLLFVRMVPISILGIITYLATPPSYVAMPIIITIFFLNGAIQSWLGPLFARVLKDVAITSGMKEAPISFRNFLQGMSRALGPAWAWILFHTGIRDDQPNTSAYAYWISAASFGLMGLVMMSSRLFPLPATSQGKAKPSPKSDILQTVKMAFKGIGEVLGKAPTLRLISLGFILPYQITVAAALSVIAPLLPIVQRKGGVVFALMGVAGSLGSALGFYIQSRLVSYNIRQNRLLWVGAFGSALAFMPLAFIAGLEPWVWYVFLFLGGSVGLLWEAFFKLSFSMKREFLGRANGLIYMAVYGGAALGSLLAPAIMQRTSAMGAFRILSVAWLVIPVIWGLSALVFPRIRNFFALRLPSELLSESHRPPAIFEAA
jgi:hypothetical protein